MRAFELSQDVPRGAELGALAERMRMRLPVQPRVN